MATKKQLERAVLDYRSVCAAALERLTDQCCKTREDDCNAPSMADACRECRRCIRTRIRTETP